jgi:hypothetical protein
LANINRRPGTQDISWFLDQHRFSRLDLDPPYQRRSVWTTRDRRYFLDTLFRGYPCPPIYLHKTIDADGAAIFHVVDGKQRLETLIRFAEGKLRISPDYGDERLNNKRWKDIAGDTEIRNRFLNYPFVVEYFDEVDSSLVNEIFERMNANSRKLTQQELRNARYDGWFSKEVDSEVDEPVWKDAGIVTAGRARRMADVQFLAELFMVVIDKRIVGFDHAAIDNAYATFEDPEDPDLGFDKDAFKQELADARSIVAAVLGKKPSLKEYLSSVSNMYVFWALLVLDNKKLPDPTVIADLYDDFMGQVQVVAEARRRPLTEENGGAAQVPSSVPPHAVDYDNANQSATTENPQRQTRLAALRKVFGIENP